MRYSLIQMMKRQASNNFKLGEAVFDGFEKIDVDESSSVLMDKESLEDLEDQLDVWANVRIEYQGKPPDSYRVLNQMIMDWVDENEESLKKIINPKLMGFLYDHYRDIDLSDLDTDFDDYIWEDQVDYCPEIVAETKEIKFVLELVLDVEEQEGY